MIAKVMAKAIPSPAPTPAIVLVETPPLLHVDDEGVDVLGLTELEVELELAALENDGVIGGSVELDIVVGRYGPVWVLKCLLVW
jgi:hypothetical protein